MKKEELRELQAQHNKKSIENWINYLIQITEDSPMLREDILTELRELRNYFFKKEN